MSSGGEPDDDWPPADPESVGVDPKALSGAVAYAKAHETPPEQVAYDFSNTHPWEGDGSLGGALGPMPDRRGGPAGIVLYDRTPVAEWGDTRRVDHTFSVAKTFLSLLAGLAWDRGLIEELSDPVRQYVDDGGFDSEQNAPITWEHLLHGTSEWEGTLFDRPDSVDRNRPVGREAEDLGERGERRLQEPGRYWEYNDVRINRLALSLLRVWEKPLPRVLAHELMDPIGATRWEWHGYYNSDVTVKGTRMRSVSGGGHWGGGLWIAARDLARVGKLLLDRGEWGGNRLLSPEYVDWMTEPCPIEPGYGGLVWLNTDRRWASAPEGSYAALGHGRNVLWIDPENELVAVLRWLESDDEVSHLDGFLSRLLETV